MPRFIVTAIVRETKEAYYDICAESVEGAIEKCETGEVLPFSVDEIETEYTRTIDVENENASNAQVF